MSKNSPSATVAHQTTSSPSGNFKRDHKTIEVKKGQPLNQEFNWKIDPNIATADEIRFAMQVWCNGEKAVVTQSATPTGDTNFQIRLTENEIKQITDTGDTHPMYMVIALVPGSGINRVVKGYMEVK